MSSNIKNEFSRVFDGLAAILFEVSGNHRTRTELGRASHGLFLVAKKLGFHREAEAFRCNASRAGCPWAERIETAARNGKETHCGGATMTIESLKSILNENPWLAAMGVNPNHPGTLERCHAAEVWLRTLFSPATKPYRDSSYAMKHTAEPTIDYTSDGEFCAAAIFLGFRVSPAGKTAVIHVKLTHGKSLADVECRLFDAALTEAGVDRSALDAALRAEAGKQTVDDDGNRVTQWELLVKRMGHAARGYDSLNNSWDVSPEDVRHAKRLMAQRKAVDDGHQQQ